VTLVLQPPAREGGVVVGAEAGCTLAVGVMQPAGRAEGVKGSTALDRLRPDKARSGHERGSFVELIRDRVVR
jgi:hypothetical protein